MFTNINVNEMSFILYTFFPMSCPSKFVNFIYKKGNFLNPKICEHIASGCPRIAAVKCKFGRG